MLGFNTVYTKKQLKGVKRKECSVICFPECAEAGLLMRSIIMEILQFRDTIALSMNQFLDENLE